MGRAELQRLLQEVRPAFAVERDDAARALATFAASAAARRRATPRGRGCPSASGWSCSQVATNTAP